MRINLEVLFGGSEGTKNQVKIVNDHFQEFLGRQNGVGGGVLVI